jgi:hypothetical protein
LPRSQPSGRLRNGYVVRLLSHHHCRRSGRDFSKGSRGRVALSPAPVQFNDDDWYVWVWIKDAPGAMGAWWPEDKLGIMKRGGAKDLERMS